MSRVVAFGPGRVNLIGEHTDYNGGLSLPFAIEDGVRVSAELEGGDEVVTSAEGASAYLRGAVAELRAAGVAVPGARITIDGDLPQGSGLSSSAALEVALCLALVRISGEDELDRLELARLCSRVENQWVGAHTGLLDQIASLFGTADHALRIDFRTLDVREVPLRLGGRTLATVDSGEQHSNAEGGYNERRRECSEAAAQLGVETLSDASRDAAARLPDPLDRRALHVLDENERVDAAVAALAAGDLPALGRLLDAGHASLRDLYDASTDAVEETVRRLKSAGAAGARMMGGGFGGHVLALFEPGAELPEDARVVTPGPGGHIVDG
jgi:galactokinase